MCYIQSMGSQRVSHEIGHKMTERLSTHFDSWVGKIPWRRNRLPTPVFLGFPGGSDGKESACNVGDLGSIPGLRRSLGEGNGYPLQFSGLENPMDRGTWRATVHGVAKSWTRLSDFYFQRYFGCLLLSLRRSVWVFLPPPTCLAPTAWNMDVRGVF